MPDNPLDAYQAVEKTTLSGRELEASVLMRAALLLADVQNNWGQAGHEERLDNALRHNQRIWTLFQAELTSPDNPLPAEIRQNLLSLSAFIDKRTFDVMAFPEPRKLDILISINKNLAAGLRGDASAE
jgi:flagellar protein FlaF